MLGLRLLSAKKAFRSPHRWSAAPRLRPASRRTSKLRSIYKPVSVWSPYSTVSLLDPLRSPVVPRSGWASGAKRVAEGRRITLRIMVPEVLAHRLPTSVLYPYPKTQIKPKRSISIPLRLPNKRQILVPHKFTVRVPKVLPLVPGSYADLHRTSLVLHSQVALRRLLKYEYNRPRFEEAKGQRRHARNGQLASVRSDHLGLIGASFASGAGAHTIANAALLSRALGG